MSNPEAPPFGLRLQEAAAEANDGKGVSQADIRRALGTSPGTVSHWWLGRSVAAGTYLVGLAEFLGVHWRWLAKGEGEKRPDTTLAPLPASIEEFTRRAIGPHATALDTMQGVMHTTSPASGSDERPDDKRRAPSADQLAALAADRTGAAIVTYDVFREGQDLLRAWIDLPRPLRDRFKRQILIASLDQSEEAPAPAKPVRKTKRPPKPAPS